MDVTKLIELLPDSVKVDVIDFANVRMKTGKIGMRVLLNRLLTDDEKRKMQSKYIVGLDCVAVYKHAPEIRHSYFYIV